MDTDIGLLVVFVFLAIVFAALNWYENRKRPLPKVTQDVSSQAEDEPSYMIKRQEAGYVGIFSEDP